MGNFDAFTGKRNFEVSMLSGETGKAVKIELQATSFMDLELQKSALVRQGHTVYMSREISGGKTV